MADDRIAAHDAGEVRGGGLALRHYTAGGSLRTLEDHESRTALDDARDLLEEARDSGARSLPFSADRAFWKGVEAAAEQVLHPEADGLATVGWFDRANLAFVSGYVQTTAMLAPAWSSRFNRSRRHDPAQHPRSA